MDTDNNFKDEFNETKQKSFFEYFTDTFFYDNKLENNDLYEDHPIEDNEFLKSLENIKKMSEISIDELKKKLNIEENYKNMNKYTNKYINTINNNLNYEIDYEIKINDYDNIKFIKLKK